MEPIKHKTVLVCPLGWGLGHAARLIPIIKNLLNDGNRVTIAGDSHTNALLKQAFPSLEPIHFPSQTIRFSKGESQLLPLIGYALKLPFFALWEHRRAKRLAKQLGADVIISDNRYGLFNASIQTVLITHQLRLLLPKPFGWVEPIAMAVIRWIASRYTEVWIPDYEGEQNLSGKLSHGLRIPANARYIGPLSRFSEMDIPEQEKVWDLMVLASGPEPHRSILVDTMKGVAQRGNLRAIIVEGRPEKGSSLLWNGDICIVSHLPDNELAIALKSAKKVVCRSGYSTIMDLHALGVSASFIPTPGQTEQEYLGETCSPC